MFNGKSLEDIILGKYAPAITENPLFEKRMLKIKQDTVIEEILDLLCRLGQKQEVIERYETHLYSLSQDSSQGCPACGNNSGINLSSHWTGHL